MQGDGLGMLLMLFLFVGSEFEVRELSAQLMGQISLTLLQQNEIPISLDDSSSAISNSAISDGIRVNDKTNAVKNEGRSRSHHCLNDDFNPEHKVAIWTMLIISSAAFLHISAARGMLTVITSTIDLTLCTKVKINV